MVTLNIFDKENAATEEKKKIIRRILGQVAADGSKADEAAAVVLDIIKAMSLPSVEKIRIIESMMKELAMCDEEIEACVMLYEYGYLVCEIEGENRNA